MAIAANFSRLMAVDPSLTCSGWALFVSGEGSWGGDLIAVGKIKSLDASHPLATRLLDLQTKITSVYESLRLSSNDVLVCESQTTMRDPRAAFKVEQVRGIFETVARTCELRVPGRLNPRSVQSEIMGLRGKQLARAVVKDTAVNIVKTVYGRNLDKIGFESSAENLSRNQDIVDAILIGSLALTKINSAELGGIAMEQAFVPKMRSAGKRLMR